MGLHHEINIRTQLCTKRDGTEILEFPSRQNKKISLSKKGKGGKGGLLKLRLLSLFKDSGGLLRVWWLIMRCEAVISNETSHFVYEFFVSVV